MSSLFERFRSGAEKAAFEADKQRRILAIQQSIRPLKKEFDIVLLQAGHTAYALHQQQQISQPELLQVCARLDNIRNQIRSQEEKIKQIRDEVHEEARVERHYGRVCPNGHGQIGPHENFCISCGASPIEVHPPSGTICQNCGDRLGSEAQFCARCGHRATPLSSAKPDPVVPVATCSKCGNPLQPDAGFCSECGHSAGVEAPPPTIPRPIMAEADLVMSDTPLKVADPEPEPATILLNEDEGLETPPLVVKAPLVDVEAEVVAESLLLEDEPVEDEPAAILLNEDEGLETPLLDVDAEAVADSLLVEDEPVKDEDEFEASSLETVVATEADRHCPDCDAVLLPDAIFCSECGRTVSEPGASENKISPPPPGLDTNACPRCGTSLLSEADFCAECGHRVV